MALSSALLQSVWDYLDLQSLLIFILVFLVFGDYVKHRRPRGFPPAPPGMPFFGNIFSFNFKKAHLDLTQLAMHYGDVYSLRLAQKWTVVLNGYKTVKEALVTQGDSMADRPDSVINEKICHHLGYSLVTQKHKACELGATRTTLVHLGKKALKTVLEGLITSNGPLWKQQRRFALSTLKYFGVGKKSLESAILDEFTYLHRDISKKNGKPFDPYLITNYGVANIICSLVFGHRFEYADPTFKLMMQIFNESLEIEASIWAQLYNSFPMVMELVPGPHKKILKDWETVKDFVRREIKQHKEDRDPETPRDYIDCYLTEIEKNNADLSGEFKEENLVMCALDLFVAGSETTSTTLRWAFLYMAKYPEVQEKVQAEIDRVIGQSRQPSVEDRVEMPYTDAVLHEIQRIGNIAPLSLPRITTRTVQIGKYTIPKGIEIIPNLTSVMFDKSEWETPNTFNPQHFLDKDGKFVRRAAFIPFSAGKRVCPGENLARMELFLFFTSFLQRFSFSMPAGEKVSMQYCLGITLSPAPYQICAIPRHPGHD